MIREKSIGKEKLIFFFTQSTAIDIIEILICLTIILLRRFICNDITDYLAIA